MKGTLKTTRQFQMTYSKGQKLVGRHMVAFALSVAEQGESSATGFVASKKVGGAVQRARGKRLLRAAFSSIREELPPSLYLVLVARASILSEGFKCGMLEAEMRQLFHKMNLLENETEVGGP